MDARLWEPSCVCAWLLLTAATRPSELKVRALLFHRKHLLVPLLCSRTVLCSLVEGTMQVNSEGAF